MAHQEALSQWIGTVSTKLETRPLCCRQALMAADNLVARSERAHQQGVIWRNAAAAAELRFEVGHVILPDDHTGMVR
jgi:hypothetical protein